MKKQDKNRINDDLLISYLAAEATDAERLQVEQWLAADAQNGKRLEHFRMLMEEASKLRSTQPADADAAWDRFSEKIDSPAQPIKDRGRLKIWLSIAATVLILFSVSLWFYFRGPGQHDLSGYARDACDNCITFAATSTPRTDTLADGSVIVLNRNSSLTYPSNPNNGQRSVTLKGDAFFNVVHDVSHPFKVSVNDVMVNVLGTSFNIRSIGNKTEISVETGVVGVNSGSKSIKLISGEKLLVTPGDNNWKKETNGPLDLSKYPGLVKAILKDPKKWPELLKSYIPQNDTTSVRGKNRQVISDVIHDIVQQKIVPDGEVKSFRLNDGELFVNDKRQPEAIHKKFKAKYLKVPGFVIYYGNSPAQGKGIFMSPDSL